MRLTCPHHVWHADLTEIRVLWKRFEIAAVLDGCSRKLLAIRAFARRPNTNDMNLLINDAVKESNTSPRFLISDHGSQFRRRFKESCEHQGIIHVKGKVRVWQINGKIERFFSNDEIMDAIDLDDPINRWNAEKAQRVSSLVQ